MKVTLSHLGLVCALGKSVEEILKNIKALSVPKLNKRLVAGREMPFGAAPVPTTKRMRCFDLLDNAVAQIQRPLENIKKEYPLQRVGIVLGSSNTGIHEAQKHINQWMETQKCPTDFSFDEIELGTPVCYLKEKTGFKGPAFTVSTACSSSAKAFASARNLLQADICDVVLVGGVDSCCDFALNGFYALEALSPQISVPFSKNRQGINLGEGAALFIMEKDKNGIEVAGIGESSDAYHLTHPDPEGQGALCAMKKALEEACIPPSTIDYINLHGTGTIANDSMESQAVYQLFGGDVLCASTKPLTGHALGASGAIEAALCWLMIRENFIIPHFYDGAYDPQLPPIHLANGHESRKIRTVLSNSFAFGGSNASLILRREV